MSELFTQQTVSGAELNAAIQTIIPVLADMPDLVAVAAMLSLVAKLMVPDLTSDELAECVEGMSGWLALHLTDIDADSTVN